MPQTVSILKLKPTQFALGMLEVNEKVKKYSHLSHKYLRKKKREPIDVVKAPNGELYMVDGHHRVCAFWMMGIKKVHVNVLKDYSNSKYSYEKFWKEMKAHLWCHLYDQFGDGPRDPVYLPQNIKGLADDPYRSLAWLAKKGGAFVKTEGCFSEFEWSNYFRSRRLIPKKFEQDLMKLLPKAVELAQLPSAKRLPGYFEGTLKR